MYKMSWSDFQQTVANSWRLMIPRERHRDTNDAQCRYPDAGEIYLSRHGEEAFAGERGVLFCVCGIY